MKNLLLTASLLMFSGIAACAQVQSYNIAPKTTDSRIDTAFNDHYAFINRAVVRRNQLVVFFPGTGGEPRNYRVFPTVAANLGFHAVGLMYPNEEQVNARCGSLSTDLDCHADIRGETLDGRDRTTKATVSRANSIENRLVKLLQYLHRLYPQDNWSQYTERTTNGDTVPLWRNIVVAGHSQGGGYAGYVAVVKRVARCIMFGAMDYNPPARRLANWMTGTKATPLGEFYAMGHERDELVPYNVLTTQAFVAYGLPPNVMIPRADTAKGPFAPNRFFSTNLESAPFGRLVTVSPLHNVPAVDVNTPVENGRPVLQSVWEYMLTAPAVATSVRATREEGALSIFPNPASNIVSLQSAPNLKGAQTLTLTNLLGQIVMTQHYEQLPTTVNISSLPAGFYVLRLASEGAVDASAYSTMLRVVR